jgi:hypothetical protein
LAIGRDIALLVLIAEAFVLGLVPLLVTYYLTRHLPPFMGRVREWLRTLYDWIVEAGTIVATIMRWLLAPVLIVAGLNAGVRAGIDTLAATRRRR